MNKYRVNVNGKTYEVEVENLTPGANLQAVPVKEAVPEAPQAASPAQPVAAAPSGGAVGSEIISSPMPGNILKVNYKPGDSVKKGDIIMVLEAMKMENEILAPCDGTVASVDVSAGAVVETGQRLCSLN